MNNQTEINVKAIELAIDLVEKQRAELLSLKLSYESEIKSMKEMYGELSFKFDNLKMEHDTLTARMDNLEVSSNNSIDLLTNRMGLVELDTGADHEFSRHKLDVRNEWAEEMGVADQLGIYDNY